MDNNLRIFHRIADLGHLTIESILGLAALRDGEPEAIEWLTAWGYVEEIRTVSGSGATHRRVEPTQAGRKWAVSVTA